MALFTPGWSSEVPWWSMCKAHIMVPQQLNALRSRHASAGVFTHSARMDGARERVC